ncbi:class I SAM-dependent methyltransferase [Exiguobacterium sp. s193]|uniref:class I SAM-dependent methyltransferase n=1 Tax=Exiguobacterium sp. s193 TaxID=2751207 RepID=UPI001BE577DD|nr:class I SAM-dependent methyltransferase [Exiguobacterium sp. s193]
MKKIVYDTYYHQDEYFGQPYPGLITFFTDHEPKGHVLDLGCGQGRGALALGKLGYTVVGIDHSSVGIAKLNQLAAHDHMAVEDSVADVYDYPISNHVDFVLLDSMLHFQKNDLKKETDFVNRILTHLRTGGMFVNCMLQSSDREQTLKNIIANSPYHFEIRVDTYTDYAEAKAKFHLLVVNKLDSKIEP